MSAFWRAATVSLLTLGAVLAIVLGISLVRGDGGSGAAQYEVTVLFNTSVTQSDIEETGALLRRFDDDLDFVIMESFPPQGRAVMAAEAPDFCQTVRAELEARSYVDSASCRPWEEHGPADPDAPVSNDGVSP